MDWVLETSQEVDVWLEALPAGERLIADRALLRLGAIGNRLRMPASEPLGDGLFELRLRLGDEARRITYGFRPGRRILLLTTFRKQRHNERREIDRARRALRMGP